MDEFISHKPLVGKQSGFQWYVQDTKLPDGLCDSITEYFEDNVEPKPGLNMGDTDPDYRKVDARWAQPHDWVGPFIWSYIERINHENFQYDLSHLAFNEVHHLTYGVGHQYRWHSDDTIAMTTRRGPISWECIDLVHLEYTRKLSFTLQLSHPDEYTGGDLQIIDVPHMFWCPKDKGSLMVFDSRLTHRVLPVKSGQRKCLVGWVLGPRWK